MHPLRIRKAGDYSGRCSMTKDELGGCQVVKVGPTAPIALLGIANKAKHPLSHRVFGVRRRRHGG